MITLIYSRVRSDLHQRKVDTLEEAAAEIAASPALKEIKIQVGSETLNLRRFQGCMAIFNPKTGAFLQQGQVD